MAEGSSSLSSKEANVKGFFHIQAPFDNVEPFVSLKALVFAKQRGLSFTECIRMAFRLLKCSHISARICFDRFFAKRLFYPKGAPTSLVVDVESAPLIDQRLSCRDEPILHWVISDNDLSSLRAASLVALDFVRSDLQSLAAQIDAMHKTIMGNRFRDYVEAHCKEAYHLGGGAQHLMEPITGSGLRCRVAGTENCFVVSTATFPRAGVANPVHTLLTCAELLTDHLAH